MAQECECTKCQQAVHFKWLILSYVNLTSIKKKEHQKSCSLLLKWDVPQDTLLNQKIKIQDNM